MCHKLVALHVWTHTAHRRALSRGERQHFFSHSVRELLCRCGTIGIAIVLAAPAARSAEEIFETCYSSMLKVGRSETTKVVKVALSPDPIKSVKAPEAPET